MKTIFSEIKRAGLFYVLYLSFVLLWSYWLLSESKADLHLHMTSWRGVGADVFFSYYTQVGEWVPFAVAAVFLFFSYRNATLLLAAQVLSGLISKCLKYLFNEPRPFLYFREHFPEVKLNVVQGVNLHLHQSFPSGHTVTAFAFFGMLIFLTSRKGWHALFFVLALLVGISRIYLQQHFAADVLAGSAIGIVSAIIVYGCRDSLFQILPKNRKSLWKQDNDE